MAGAARRGHPRRTWAVIRWVTAVRVAWSMAVGMGSMMAGAVVGRECGEGAVGARVDATVRFGTVPCVILPESWSVLLEPLRGVFRRRGTFMLFTVLATGMVAQTGRRSVVGMLAGARMATTISFHAACRFFSHAVWDVDQLGLAVARLVVTRLAAAEVATAGPGDGPAPAGTITVAIDDTLFRRWGKKVFAAFWTHDGAAQGKHKIGRGNRWIIAGIVVRLPFCSSPVCLPVLFRLWRGKGTASHVDLAAELMKLIIDAFPGWRVHGVGDAAYHGKALVTPQATWTTRLPHNATLYALPPDRTGKPGRPRLKGKVDSTGEFLNWLVLCRWTVAVGCQGRMCPLGCSPSRQEDST